MLNQAELVESANPKANMPSKLRSLVSVLVVFSLMYKCKILCLIYINNEFNI